MLKNLARTWIAVLCVAGGPALSWAGPAAAAAAAALGPAGAATGITATVSAGAVAAADAQAQIKRFIQVDDRFYRGSQPDEEGFKALRDMGVRTVVSLRTGENASERRVVESLGMTFVHIPVSMSAFDLTTDTSRQAVSRFFGVVDNPASGKVFLHCRRGADRTGTFVGLYRIARQGWDSGQAYDEARDVGMRWWYSGVKQQLKTFADSLADTLATRSIQN